jgi:hypothetical protein
MTVPHQETWDLYKATIERFIAEGYAPPHKRAGTIGSAIVIAAQELKIGHSTLNNWVRTQESRAAAGKDHRLPDWSLWSHDQARKGKLGYSPVLPGFEIKRTSTSTDQAGNVKGQHVTQVPAAGEIFEMPAGHTIKGVSAHLGPDGRINHQWVKTKQGPNSPEAIEAIKAVFDEYKGRAAPCGHTVLSYNDDLLTVYVVGDHHLGLYCWKDETGRDYDLDIGAELLHSTMSNLVASAPAAGTAIVLSLGDFFHMDSSANTTTAGTSVDGDTRRAKVYKVGVKLMISCIEMALQKHNKVIVRCLPGNHDQETTPTLAISLWAFFHNEPKVDVDCSPSKFFHYQHGFTMLSSTHGHECKVNKMPGVMASSQPAMWGATRFRYALSGHIHHKEMFCKEEYGVICETFQVLPPPDAWHVGMGFGSGRSMTAINYHRDRGEVSRNICSVSPVA